MNLNRFIATIIIVSFTLTYLQLYVALRFVALVLSVFVVLRFGQVFIDILRLKYQSTSEDKLIAGIVYVWTGNIFIGLSLAPYGFFQQYNVLLTSNPWAAYLVMAGASLHIIGAFLHLIAHQRPLRFEQINIWARIGIPLAFLAGILGIFFSGF